MLQHQVSKPETLHDPMTLEMTRCPLHLWPLPAWLTAHGGGPPNSSVSGLGEYAVCWSEAGPGILHTASGSQ